jgi:Ca2+-transporting ATPase
MTLTDDNFATIVEAVREGRGIYANIKKVVGFLLGTNIGEILAVFLSMVLWQQTPLLSMQLLWINLVTDSLPAIALGMERAAPQLMDQKPKPKAEGIFAHGMGVRIVLQGVMFMILTLVGFQLGLHAAGDVTGGRTMAFLVLSMSQVIHSFNMRSNRSLLKTGPFGNRKLNWAVLGSVLLILLVLFTPVSIPFGLIALPVWIYLTGFGLALVPVLIIELSKATGLIRDRD